MRTKEEYNNGKPESVKLRELYNIIGGTPYGVDFDKEIVKLAHVKRNIEKGCLFFAFRTWRVDTYANVMDAIEKGAAAIVTEKYIEDYPCIVVEDSHKAFMDVCKWYRNQMDVDVIAVSGSIGKTSTKEMIACVLQQAFCIEKNDANSNSSDLAARNLSYLNGKTEKLVQEVAIQNIKDTSMAIQPTVCVLTNIGYSHVETFGSRENIFTEKTKLLTGMVENGLVVLNSDDDMLAGYGMDIAKDKHVLTYALANENADIRADKICKDATGYQFEICYKENRYPAKTTCQGIHNVLNALAAFAVGIYMEMDVSDIVRGIKQFQPTGYRQNLMKKDSMLVLADCFNAAPDSVKAALDTLESMDVEKDGKRIAVLGDMLELGEYSGELHEQVGDYINRKHIDMVVLYGEEVRHTKHKIINEDIEVKHVVRRKDLIDTIKKDVLGENNVILFKGSHGMELEGVIDEFFGTDFSRPESEKIYTCGRLKREKCNLTEYFQTKGYKTAAIYGISVDEEELIDMLTDAGIHVKYAIDRKAKYLPDNLYKIPVVTLEDAEEEEKVDMVFVSLLVYNESLLTDIAKKTGAEILTYKRLKEELLK